MTKDIESFIKTFFKKLGIKLDKIDINTEKENIFQINIETKESGLLIWPHWKNLNAIQILLTIFIWNLLQTKIILHIEINDYKKNIDEKLFNFIKSKIDLVKRNWKNIKLPFYSAYERKKIHSFVAELWDNLIYTKSEWESIDRRLYIYKKNEKITIDIDSNDI